jgi:hypothetical protein
MASDKSIIEEFGAAEVTTPENRHVIYTPGLRHAKGIAMVHRALVNDAATKKTQSGSTRPHLAVQFA